jgi:hypothetical protein
LACKHKEARAILDKIAPIMVTIGALEAGPEFELLAAQIREPMTAKKLWLQNVVATATITMSSVDSADLPDLCSLREVLDTIAGAKKVLALITGVLAAMARAHR